MKAVYGPNGDCIPVIPDYIFIWWGLNDIVIGLYYLFIFILPLRTYIQIDKKGSDNPELSDIAKRILTMSSTMLITSIIAAVIAAVWNAVASYAFGFDGLINTICVILQFKPVDFSNVPDKWKCFMKTFQCEYTCKAEKRFDDVVMIEAEIRANENTKSTNTKASAEKTEKSTNNAENEYEDSIQQSEIEIAVNP